MNWKMARTIASVASVHTIGERAVAGPGPGRERIAPSCTKSAPATFMMTGTSAT